MKLLDFIAANVHRSPDVIAIESEGIKMTYAELWEASDAAANRMPHVAGMAVAIQLNNSLDFVVWLLAVWKKDGVAVPVDVHSSKGMTKLIIEKAQPVVWISRGRGGVELEKTTTRIPCHSFAAGIINVIFTSGSSGEPKAVMQSNSGMKFFAGYFGKVLGIREGTRVSWLYSPAFSASMMDILSVFLHGATLVAFDLPLKGIYHAEQWLQSANLEVLHTVPSVFRVWLQKKNAERLFASLRVVDLGGELITKSDVNQWLSVKSGEAKLFNHLAATEASVIAMEELSDASILENGWSHFAVSVDLVDDNGKIVEASESGKIRLTSPFISPGYLGASEAQQKAFLTSENGESRSFVSDDLGQWSGKNLRLLGRSSRRIKIRGLAVDLDEIENSISVVPGILDAAVVQHSKFAGQLVAWLVVGPQFHLDATAMRSTLKEDLPDYAIPTFWENLDAIPLNANGKRDLKLLSEKPLKTCSPLGELKGNFEILIGQWFQEAIPELSTALESSLDFFEAGGDSLAFGHFHAKFEAAAGKNVPQNLLLGDTKIKGLATLLSQLRKKELSVQWNQVLMQLRSADNGLPVFIVHGRDGEAFVSPFFLEQIEHNRPVYAFRIHGMSLEEVSGLKTCHDLAHVYVREMKRVQPHGPYSLVSLCIGYKVAMCMAKILKGQGETVLPIAFFDPPFVSNLPVRWLRFISFKRRLQNVFLGLTFQFSSGRDVEFVNGINPDMNWAMLEKRNRIIWRFLRLLHKCEMDDFVQPGILFLSESTSRAPKPSCFKHMNEVLVAKNHEEVIDVRNSVFAMQWKKFEREILNQVSEK